MESSRRLDPKTEIDDLAKAWQLTRYGNWNKNTGKKRGVFQDEDWKE